MNYQEHAADNWTSAEVSPAEAAYVMETVARTPYLSRGLQQLGEGLGETSGSSRMLLRLPVNMPVRDALRAMTAAAHDLGELAQTGNLGREGGHYVVLDNHSVSSGELEVPPGVKAGMSSPHIGYVRVERLENGQIQNSVGSLDTLNRRHHSLTLPRF